MNIREEFDKNGYIILKGVFNKEELKTQRDLTDRIVEYADKNLEDPFDKYYLGHRSDQGVLYDLYQRHPEFRKLAMDDKLVNAVKQILGEDVLIYENSLVFKPKNKQNEVPWHQDFIDRPDEPLKIISWMALDDIKKENGALKFIPESHKMGFSEWYKVKGDAYHTRVKADNLDTSKAIYAELEAGDVLIFHQLIFHSSDRVSSENPRRAFRVSFQGFEQILSPRATPIVVSGGSPESMEKRFTRKKEDLPKKTFIQKIAHGIAYRLSKV